MKNILYALFGLLLVSAADLNAQHLNTTLRDSLDYPVGVNDVWGYAAPDGTEYAFVGLQNALSIVSLANPDSLQEILRIPGQSTTWRDIKTHGEYAYVISESAGQGLLIIDLSTLPDTPSYSFQNIEIPGTGSALTRAHNLYIDPATGLAYFAGGGFNNGGMVIADVSTYGDSVFFVAMAPGVYSHDVFVQDDLMYASEIYEGSMTIYDVSDVDSITLVSTQPTPFDFTHNIWTTSDGKTAFTTDERANAPVAAYDITDPSQPVALDEFRPERSLNQGTIPHNVHVQDEYLIISYYTDGVEIADASVPDNIIEVAYYDTWPGPDGNFNGNWGAYPFLPSGLVLATDRSTGLYVVEVDYQRAARLHGNITDGVTGAELNNVIIEITGTEDDMIASTDATGNFKTGTVFAGEYTATLSLFGYTDLVVPVTLENGVITLLDTVMFTLTDVEEVKLAGLEVEVFPNPSAREFYLNYTLPGVAPSSLELVVTDLNGRQVERQVLAPESLNGRLPFGENLAAGSYFLQLQVDGQTAYTTKVVKQ